MPHISKRKVSDKNKKKLQEYLLVFLMELTDKQRRDVFSEVFTETEKVMLAKRLAMVLLISKDFSINKIADALKMSPSTIQRFYLKFETGKLDKTSKWLAKKTAVRKLMSTIGDIIFTALNPKDFPLGKFLDEEL